MKKARPTNASTAQQQPNDLGLSSATVKQIVSDQYHSAMLNSHGNSYLIYRKLWEDAITGNHNPSHPLHVDFELFNACNYRCSFCPYSAPESKRPRGFNVKGEKRLGIDLIEKVLRESSGRLYAVELGYNTEPLLHKEIVNIIKLCRDHGVLDIRLGTNGSMLNLVNSAELVESGLTQLQVSIDAIDIDSYKRARQSDLYKEVVGNVKDFIDSRDKLGSLMPRLRVTYVMTPENKPYADIFKEQWQGIADIIGFQDLITYSDVNLSVNSSDLKSISVDEFQGCYMPKVRLSIRSDGTVHPCCTVPGMKLRMGNVKDNKLEEIWASPAMLKIRSSHFDGSWIHNRICNDCISGTKN